MKKLVLALLATAALVTVTAASAGACNGSGHNSGRFGRSAGVEKLNGTGSGFHSGSAGASGAIVGHPLQSGNFSASLTPDWSNSVTKDGRTCAPTTGTLSLTGGDSSNAVTSSVQGLTCTVPSNSDVVAVFFGRAKVTSSTGAASKLGEYGRVFLAEKTDGTVKGFAFLGAKRGFSYHRNTFRRR